MSKWCVLFRAINVGGNNILPMKALVTLLESMGCSEVKTYIQSGNVVLQHAESSADKLTSLIRQEVEKAFNITPQVLLLSSAQFAHAVSNNPFIEVELKFVHWFFLSECPTTPDLKSLELAQKSSESFKLIDKVFYLYAPEGVGRSKLMSKVEKCLAVPATARNGNTVNKLWSLLN